MMMMMAIRYDRTITQQPNSNGINWVNAEVEKSKVTSFEVNFECARLANYILMSEAPNLNSLFNVIVIGFGATKRLREPSNDKKQAN